MKSCPTCNRTYSDETLSFCLVDGTVLSAPYDPKALNQYAASDNSEAPPTEELRPTDPQRDTLPALLPPTISPPPPPVASEAGPTQRHRPTRRPTKLSLIIGVAALFVTLIVVINRMPRFRRNTSPIAVNRPAEVESTNSSPRTSSSLKESPPIANATTGESSPTPGSSTQNGLSLEAPPSAKERPNIIGTWKGRYYQAAATMSIVSQKDNSFFGTLSCVGFLIRVNGHLDPDTRQLTIRETAIIRMNPRYDTWYLGTNSGSISGDGKTMSGIGRGRKSYSWSFSRR